MKTGKLFEVRVDNRDRTRLYFVAKNKIEALDMYTAWVKEKNAPDYVSENTDFEIEYKRDVRISESL